MARGELTKEEAQRLQWEQEYQAWLLHPTTQAFREYLRKKREYLKEEWANAGFVSSHDVADVYQNAGAVSAASVYKELLELESQDLFGDSNEK